MLGRLLAQRGGIVYVDTAYSTLSIELLSSILNQALKYYRIPSYLEDLYICISNMSKLQTSE